MIRSCSGPLRVFSESFSDISDQQSGRRIDSRTELLIVSEIRTFAFVDLRGTKSVFQLTKTSEGSVDSCSKRYGKKYESFNIVTVGNKILILSFKSLNRSNFVLF